MGLDLMLVRYTGKDSDGCLQTDHVGHQYDNWNSDRYSIRKDFIGDDHVDWDSMMSDEPRLDGGLFIMRPFNFEDARKWSAGLNESEKEYIDNILDILEKEDDLYIELSY